MEIITKFPQNTAAKTGVIKSNSGTSFSELLAVLHTRLAIAVSPYYTGIARNMNDYDLNFSLSRLARSP